MNNIQDLLKAYQQEEEPMMSTMAPADYEKIQSPVTNDMMFTEPQASDIPAIQQQPQTPIVAQAEAPQPQAPETPEKPESELNRLERMLQEARKSDRALKVGGAIGDALATVINARSQMNVKAPGVQVQQGAGLGKVADMFATAPEIRSDLLDKRKQMLEEYKLLAKGKDGEKIYQTKTGLVRIDKDGKPVEIYSDPSIKRGLDLTEKRINQGSQRLGLSTTAEDRRLSEFEFKKKEADELKPKELDTVTGIDMTLDSLDRLSDLNKDFWTGPIEGRISQMSRLLGTDSEAKTKLAAQMEMILSKYAKQISGTAVGEQEFERLRNQLPNETDSDAAFAAKFSNFKEELEATRSRFIQSYGKVRNVEGFKEREPLQQKSKTIIRFDPKSKRNVEYDADTKKPIRFVD